MPDIAFPIAFISGLASFFAPCVVPLLPAYIGYVTGASAVAVKNKKPYLGIFTSGLIYTLGFTLVFASIGGSLSYLGSILRTNDMIIQRVGGFVILVMGLNIAGIFKIGFLNRGRSIAVPKWAQKSSYFKPFMMGVVFALAWSPCVGAVLGSILALSAVTQTATRGALLLLTYSIGIAFPFLLISLTLPYATNYLKLFERNAKKISLFSGILLSAVGALLLFGYYGHVNSWLWQIAFSLGYEIH